MAARKSTRVNRKYKTKYRVTNWREYERGLRSRGDITVWFSDEAREAWTPPKNGRRGGQPRYSNLAIVTALTRGLTGYPFLWRLAWLGPGRLEGGPRSGSLKSLDHTDPYAPF